MLPVSMKPAGNVGQAQTAANANAHSSQRDRQASRNASNAASGARSAGYSLTMQGGGLLTIAYIVIGAFVAAANQYFAHIGTIEGVASAIIAILLWPLVLIGIDIRIT